MKTIFFSLILCYLIFCQSCMRMRMTPKETKTFFKTSKTAYVDSSIDINGYTIHYIETGKKDASTLFFVHGSPGSWDAYKDYLKDSLLLSKYRMIAIDRIGFGYSNFGKAENLKTNTFIIEKFVKQTSNGKPIYLIGHSLGGPTIVQMAAEQPADYAGLIILAGSVDPKAETPENWRPIIMAKPLRYFIPGALRPSNDECWWLKSSLYELEPKLENITSKVIIIHGTKDQLVPYSNVGFLRRELVNAKTLKVISIKDANHFIPWTHFKEIRDVLYQLE
ncbi:alpha/beta fold hydrolase [Flavobacterium wongokense]|uniref:alpha/beta fold hydrolase n=1 Tax=Flavobacterium wongokense TaxID=2910674 RepID=UPI001F1CFB30|nr:alpha/beta hydrolase [Flavobacterium sp. WG47]MCF6132917.1 alpha/beta hydrolase [Flavobacterium sp. WG47]